MARSPTGGLAVTPREVLLSAADLLEAEGWADVFIHGPEGWSMFGAVHHQLYPEGHIKDPDAAKAAYAIQNAALDLVKPLMTWTNYGYMGWDMAPGMTAEKAITALRTAAQS